jgi:hypothetical protein
LVFITTACALGTAAVTTGSTDPLPDAEFVLVTPNAAPSVTPFRPALASPLPSFTPIMSATEAPSATPTLIPSNLPTFNLQPSTTPLPTDTSAPAPTAGDKPQYLITAQMDYANHTVIVSETILYPNTSNDALASLLLGVNPMLWTNAFHLHTFSLNDQDWGNYTLSGQNLTVSLPAALQPGQAVKLGIGYSLLLPYSNGKFENFGYTNRQTTLIDWYPFVVPYVPGAGWVLPEPYPYGENLVYPEADFRVSLSFADANPPVVAASAPASLDENGALVYVLPNARNFSFAASHEFLMSSADANGVAIYNYYFPEDAAAAAMALEMTRLAVNTYSTSFGPYVHSALTVVETDLNDGLETDGLYFLARNFYRAYDGSVQNNLSVIAVHETAHQWWYGAVANNQATEPWLDEAMATYSEHVFYETNYPGLVNWWWNFRVNSKNPTGSVDLRVYDTGTFQAYVGAVYFQGANFFDALRLRIGDADFFAFLRDYYARERGSISSAAAFFAILDGHTNVDYSDLLTTYFYYR